MDVVVKGRRGIEVPEHFRQHVQDKLSRVERLDHYVSRIEVELSHEPNPRQSDICQRVEITCRTRGPVLRAEACAADFLAAVDTAAHRLEARVRRLADRRRDHNGHHRRVGLSDVPVQETAPLGDGIRPVAPSGEAATSTATLAPPAPDGRAAEGYDPDGGHVHGDPGHVLVDGQVVVREKTHSAEPMSIDQALLEMELVGHDFYLFNDADTGLPSVVYRRRGYDYGVIRLTR